MENVTKRRDVSEVLPASLDVIGLVKIEKTGRVHEETARNKLLRDITGQGNVLSDAQIAELTKDGAIRPLTSTIRWPDTYKTYGFPLEQIIGETVTAFYDHLNIYFVESSKQLKEIRAQVLKENKPRSLPSHVGDVYATTQPGAKLISNEQGERAFELEEQPASVVIVNQEAVKTSLGFYTLVDHIHDLDPHTHRVFTEHLLSKMVQSLAQAKKWQSALQPTSNDGEWSEQLTQINSQYPELLNTINSYIQTTITTLEHQAQKLVETLGVAELTNNSDFRSSLLYKDQPIEDIKETIIQVSQKPRFKENPDLLLKLINKVLSRSAREQQSTAQALTERIMELDNPSDLLQALAERGASYLYQTMPVSEAMKTEMMRYQLNQKRLHPNQPEHKLPNMDQATFKDFVEYIELPLLFKRLQSDVYIAEHIALDPKEEEICWNMVTAHEEKLRYDVHHEAEAWGGTKPKIIGYPRHPGKDTMYYFPTEHLDPRPVSTGAQKAMRVLHARTLLAVKQHEVVNLLLDVTRKDTVLKHGYSGWKKKKGEFSTLLETSPVSQAVFKENNCAGRTLLLYAALTEAGIFKKNHVVPASYYEHAFDITVDALGLARIVDGAAAKETSDFNRTLSADDIQTIKTGKTIARVLPTDDSDELTIIYSSTHGLFPATIYNFLGNKVSGTERLKEIALQMTDYVSPNIWRNIGLALSDRTAQLACFAHAGEMNPQFVSAFCDILFDNSLYFFSGSLESNATSPLLPFIHRSLLHMSQTLHNQSALPKITDGLVWRFRHYKLLGDFNEPAVKRNMQSLLNFFLELGITPAPEGTPFPTPIVKNNKFVGWNYAP